MSEIRTSDLAPIAFRAPGRASFKVIAQYSINYLNCGSTFHPALPMGVKIRNRFIPIIPPNPALSR